MRKRIAIALFVALVGAVDGFIKTWALTGAPTVPTHAILGIAIHKNPGIAFDIAIPLWIVIALSVGVIGSVAVMTNRDGRLPIFIAGSLIIVGAVDNAVDRIVHGFTTDYLIFFSRSVINIADILILTGAAIFVWYYRTTPARSK